MCGSSCVGIYNFKPRIKITSVEDAGNGHYDLNAVVHYQPQTWIEKWGHTFQSVIKAEKVAQVANELYHLFEGLLRTHAATGFFRYVNGIHEGAHNLQELLHSITFLSDVCAILSGRFVAYHKNRKIDYLLTTSRVLHFVSHCLAPIFLFMDYTPLRKIRSGLIIAGSAGAIISTLQHRNKNSASDLTINSCSIIFESFSYIPQAGAVQSLAGIIQGVTILRRLSPSDEKFKILFDPTTRPGTAQVLQHLHDH